MKFDLKKLINEISARVGGHGTKKSINLDEVRLPEELKKIITSSPSVRLPETREDLFNWALGRMTGETNWSINNREDHGRYEVAFDVPGKGRVVEAIVAKVRNGLSINYVEPIMRRRDPDAMVIGDDKPTDKPTFKERFEEDFTNLRTETLNWLSEQTLILVPFYAGLPELKIGCLLVCPRAAGFFATALADLQGMIPISQLPEDFNLNGGIIYVAPPFRHSRFNGKQVVVHNRTNELHEIFSYNLYPGPSAKKGVYSILIDIGEKEGWVANHCSAVTVETPYDNQITIMHEGASGGGKSEMLEHIHRLDDGRLLLGRNVVTGEELTVSLPTACKLYPLMDDMGTAHPIHNQGHKHLRVADSENAWFIRVDHIHGYGTSPYLEKMSVTPAEPLAFLNINSVPGSMALIWEHTEDAPGQLCPNPRMIVQRKLIENIKDGDHQVDIRSFGVRCPPTHADSRLYGILGLFQVLNPALAWLWRLVAPRGHDNPSIQDSVGMTSEGVGSYWAFCTGRRVDQANLLLKQIQATPKTNYVLIPNKHIGAWQVGFMAQWISREYFARRGGVKFRPEQLCEAECSLLGRLPKQVQIEGTLIPDWLIFPEMQGEVGPEIYANGSNLLKSFFKKELKQFLVKDLDPVGKKIIDACMSDATVQDYDKLL
jgi:hypothetical protein